MEQCETRCIQNTETNCQKLWSFDCCVKFQSCQFQYSVVFSCMIFIQFVEDTSVCQFRCNINYVLGAINFRLSAEKNRHSSPFLHPIIKLKINCRSLRTSVLQDPGSGIIYQKKLYSGLEFCFESHQQKNCHKFFAYVRTYLIKINLI